MHSVRTQAVIIPLVVAISIFILWALRRPLAPIVYIIGLVPLCVAVALTFAPRIESNYEQTYWLEKQRYSIPWTYGPYNGQTQPGGTRFLVRVWGTELKPYYQYTQNQKDLYILTKAVDFDHGIGGPSPETDCVADSYNFRCEWKKGEYVYAMSINADSAPIDAESLFQPIEELLDGFQLELP